jgi:hypothetical protein
MAHTIRDERATRVTLWEIWSKGGFGMWFIIISACCFYAAFMLLNGANSVWLARSSFGQHPHIAWYIYPNATGVRADIGHSEPGREVGNARYSVYSHDTGFPAPWRTEEEHFLSAGCDPSSGYSNDQARTAIVEYIRTHGHDADDPRMWPLVPLLDRIAAGRFYVTNWHVDGIAIDVGFALGLLVGIAAWILGLRWMFRRCKRRARYIKGLCPGCGYSMEGLDSSTCPECGGQMPRAKML